MHLHDTLRHHGLGYLHEACHIGSLHIVDIAVGLGAVLYAVGMNVLHDGVQALIYLLGSP